MNPIHQGRKIPALATRPCSSVVYLLRCGSNDISGLFFGEGVGRLLKSSVYADIDAPKGDFI